MWTGRESWGRGWGFLVHRAKQQKGKLRSQLQSAQAWLLTCRPTSSPHLMAHRLHSLHSRALGQGVQAPKGGAQEKAQAECLPSPCKLSPLLAGLSHTILDLAGPTTDPASPDAACRLPLPPAPGGSGHTKPVPLNHYHP